MVYETPPRSQTSVINANGFFIDKLKETRADFGKKNRNGTETGTTLTTQIGIETGTDTTIGIEAGTEYRNQNRNQI